MGCLLSKKIQPIEVECDIDWGSNIYSNEPIYYTEKEIRGIYHHASTNRSRQFF
jgi:hypothetical protein